MALKLNHIALLILFLTVFQKDSETPMVNDHFKLIDAPEVWSAGQDLQLKFKSATESKPLLYCSNSYGSTIIEPHLENTILSYSIPQAFTKKSGVLRWTILSGASEFNGQITIRPLQETAKIESYLGPPSIEAGGSDYTMLVVIPTDRYDNTLTNQTKVTTHRQFLEQQTSDSLFTFNGFAYQNFYSPRQSGRMLLSSSCIELNSKEYTVVVNPAIPTTFTISENRPHQFADGNQITTFETSIITDRNKNVVSDGTYVEFYITTDENTILKTSGLTINGIAKAQMIHPDTESYWTVKAYVEGISESNEITLHYSQVVEDFKVVFSENSRTISVGPIQSFMGQMIPDGLNVHARWFKNTTEITSATQTTVDGFVIFEFEDHVLPKDNYTIEIETAGQTKQFNAIAVW
ncbi:hypothetical protein AB9K26_14735 [Psychroserpens sp. XS_ASV72]|uniref:hypothetical protein n=1 Tax=Psychroserpens sp. XS_ASV72 TaxID=3241293 RepID=UPI0035123F5C